MSKRFDRGIWWIKRDFRLADNDALLDAVEHCHQVSALFILEPSLCCALETSRFHYRAWHQATEHLRTSLQSIGGELTVVCGEAVNVLERLRAEQGFDALFSHEETGSDITYTRDKAVRHWADRHAIHWHEAYQNGVIRGLVDRGKRQPVIRERLMTTTPRPPPARVTAWDLSCVAEEKLNEWPEFETLSGRRRDDRIELENTQGIDEANARKVLNTFLSERAVGYSGGISSPNSAFTAGSRLSAHLAWGTLSLRQVFHATWRRDKSLAGTSDASSMQWRKSLKAFQSRLHWHDHFIQRLESAPSMEFSALNPAYRQLAYGDNEQLLDAWQNGRTGLPLVDACMRCLAATGFLNFRMRAMVVSAACFGLAQSWQSLQYPLARLFLDYEPGIHFSQIQMQAGIVGINTIRIYSPHKQLLEQDPDAKFVKRWIPELHDFDAAEIAQYNSKQLGDYPEPVTDIIANTRVIRDQIYAIRKSAEGQEASADVLVKHGSRLPGNDRQKRKTKGKKAANKTVANKKGANKKVASKKGANKKVASKKGANKKVASKKGATKITAAAEKSSRQLSLDFDSD